MSKLSRHTLYKCFSSGLLLMESHAKADTVTVCSMCCIICIVPALSVRQSSTAASGDTSRIDWYPKMVAHQTSHEHEIPRRSSRDTQCTPFGIATLSSAIQRMPPNCRLSSNTAAIGDLRKTTREMEKCASPPTIVAKENLPRRRDLGCCM